MKYTPKTNLDFEVIQIFISILALCLLALLNLK